MRIIAPYAQGVRGRIGGHRDQSAVKGALDSWFHEVNRAHRRNAADIKRSYASASIVSADRVVFNVKGNDYRLIVAVGYEREIV